MNVRSIRLALLVVLALGVSRTAGAQFLPIDLGTLGGDESEAVAVNESGHVAGSSLAAGNAERHAFFWDRLG